MSEISPSAEKARRGGFMGVLRRMVNPSAEQASADLRRDAALADAQPVGSCRDREHVKLYGAVESVAPSPVNEPAALEVDLRDESGTVTLIWMGRRGIRGIAPGTTLTAEGRMAWRKKHRVIYNPRYELVTVPDASGGHMIGPHR